MNPKITFKTTGQKADSDIAYGFYFDNKPILRDSLCVDTDVAPEELALRLQAFSNSLAVSIELVSKMESCASKEECMAVAGRLLNNRRRGNLVCEKHGPILYGDACLSCDRESTQAAEPEAINAAEAAKQESIDSATEPAPRY